MARKIISDSHEREDFGYNRGHSQTQGGINAYNRGEKPMTYWDKKKILSGVFERLSYMRSSEEWYRKYRRFLRDMNLSEAEIKEQLKKTSKADLQTFLLEFTGFHLTGNYYRHTNFYNIVEMERLLPQLKKYVLKPKVYEQLTIKEVLQ